MLSAEYVDATFSQSPGYCLVCVTLGLTCGIALWHTDLSPMLKGSLWLAVIATLADSARREGLRLSADSILYLRGSPDAMRVGFRDGRVATGRIEPPLVVAPGYVALRLALPGGSRRRLLVCADSMDENAYRRLRVYLKLASHTVAE